MMVTGAGSAGGGGAFAAAASITAAASVLGLASSAEGLGALGILIPKDRSTSVTPGTYHASVGAVETLAIVQVNNLNEALRKLKDAGFWIVGTKLGEGAKPLKELPDFEKVVLVLGSELQGLSPAIAKTCDWLVEITLRGKIQSLNVSNAGAILMYELTRRLGWI